MAREKKQPEQKAGCPEWLATYGDMVTLVLTFFVLLFSFSTIDAKKWQEVAAALSGSPSIFDGLNMSANPIADKKYEPVETTEIDMEYLLENSDVWDALVKEVESMLKQSNDNVGGQATMTSDATRIKVELSGDILFDPGSDVVREESVAILVDVVEQLKPYLPLIGTLRIEGHTDNVPMNTPKFPSNWELSQGRSMSVLRYLFKMFEGNPDFPQSLFSVGGYGEEHPIDTNDTPEGRARNRRVTFVIEKSPDYNTMTPVTVPPDEVPAP